MKSKKEILNFYKGKRILVTGHTGFKGSWLTKILINSGAIVTGYSLTPPTKPALFSIAHIEEQMSKSVIGDIRNFECLNTVFEDARPEIVFHLAAQPIVRTSYQDPRMTYETNVMGTVNICEAVRLHDCVRSFLNITTDKVYKNREWCWGYRENEMLDGYDPYSNSKSCSELVTHSYINSFFGGNSTDSKLAVSTARAGNVIGGGDFASNRIIPDCVRAVENNCPLIIRNPNSTRPYQHVLEPLFLYLLIAEEQFKDHTMAGFYNVGPDDCDCITTGELVDLFSHYWNNSSKIVFNAEVKTEESAPHEANFLKLDTSLVKSTFGWKPTWHINDAVKKTVDFTRLIVEGASAKELNYEMDNEINAFMENKI